MGRFYTINVTPPIPLAAAPVSSWSSLTASGADDPGALNVQFDFQTSFFGLGLVGGSTLTIEGVPLSVLRQASLQYAGQYVTVAAGMTPGLPLATTQAGKKAGIILQGQIVQAYGNWVGTEMSLDLVVYPAYYTQAKPGNIVLNWPAGSSLSSALGVALNTAYPSMAQQINIGSQYVFSHDTLAFYQTFAQLAKFIKSKTALVNPPNGVDMTIQNNTIIVSDGSTAQNAIQLAFTDLIGQPTWIDVNVIVFTTAMRADIQVGSVVQMPAGLQNLPGIVTTAASSAPSQLKYQTAFQGNFVVQKVRQIGNFRDPAGTSWATVFQAQPQVSAA